MIAHIAKRLFFVVLGYFAALAAGAAAFPGILILVNTVSPGSEIEQVVGLGPIALVVAPVILIYIMSIVMILTFIPAAILKLITEIFALRWLWLHLLISLALAAGAGLMIIPDWFSGMSRERWLVTIAVALSALIGGVVYWAVAGQRAGFRRETVTPSVQPS